MKVSEYVADFIADLNTRVYGICGAGAMHLNDSIAHHPRIHLIPMQHEQAAAYAAEADARVTGRPAVVHTTVGPGGSNALTGVACAYVDSIPMLVIAGQVTKSSMIGTTGLRQNGMNELDMVALMQPITKFAMTVSDPFMIRYYLEKALYCATYGRKGPVFLEIPLDVQSAEIQKDKLTPFNAAELQGVPETTPATFESVLSLLEQAKRPVIIAGNGIRLAGATSFFHDFTRRLCIPVVTSWTASDLDPWCRLGCCGIFGDYASNYAVQNADFILAIGTRLSVAQIGHHAKLFAPHAIKVVVDIDYDEACKLNPELPIRADAKEFLANISGDRLDSAAVMNRVSWKSWLDQCTSRLRPVNTVEKGGKVDAYWFVRALQNDLDDDAVVVTDVGFCFIPTMQSVNPHGKQRLFHSCGVSPMGWGIPAAIGACLANEKKRQTICLTGDGGLMLNLQELHTIGQLHLPISIFVFCNDGYATMRIAQQNHFKREAMSGPSTGVNLPVSEIKNLGDTFGLSVMEIRSNASVRGWLWQALADGKKGPNFTVVHLDPHQLINPRVVTKSENGKFLPTTLENMSDVRVTA